jgi:L-rhamnose mutarotase
LSTQDFHSCTRKTVQDDRPAIARFYDDPRNFDLLVVEQDHHAHFSQESSPVVWFKGEAAYEAAHRNVPEELTAAIRAAGVHSWTIWRSGLDLFHVVECDDYRAMLARLEQLPVNVAWQARMAELLDVVHDYSGEADAELPVAWQL